MLESDGEAALRDIFLKGIQQSVNQEIVQKVDDGIRDVTVRGNEAVGHYEASQDKELQRLEEELDRLARGYTAVEANQATFSEQIHALDQKLALTGVTLGASTEAFVAAGFAVSAATGSNSNAACRATSDSASGPVASIQLMNHLADLAGESTTASRSSTSPFATPLVTPLRTPLSGGSSSSSSTFANVPEFPFPATRTPVSLASALEVSFDLIDGTANGWATGCANGPSASSSKAGGAAGQILEISLKRAKGMSLGLDVAHSSGHDKVLTIKHVKPDGAIEAWNRRCRQEGGAMLEQVIRAGDRIASVNNVAYNAERMLQECTESEDLKLMVLRSGSADNGSRDGAVLSHEERLSTGGEEEVQPVLAERRVVHGAHRKAAKAAALVIAAEKAPAPSRSSAAGREPLPPPAPAQATKAGVKAMAKAAAVAVDNKLQVAPLSTPAGPEQPGTTASPARKRPGRRGGRGAKGAVASAVAASASSV